MLARILTLCFAISVAATERAGADDLHPNQFIDLLDQTFAEHWREQGLQPTAPIDDASFLRRLSLDLRGTIPTPDDVAGFLRDRAPGKRAAKVREYLNDPETAEYRATVWSDLLLSEAPKGPEQIYLYPWLVDAFQTKMPFDELVHALIAATGKNDEVGAASFVLPYRTQPEVLAAVTARTFLGVQIQCAQCHDHPYEDWSQQNFQEFAAFFAYTSGRQVDADSKPPVYELFDQNEEEYRQGQWQKLLKLIRRHQNSAAEEAIESRLATDKRRRLKPSIFQRDKALNRLLESLPAETQQRIRDAKAKQEQFAVAKTLDQAIHDHGQAPRREQLAAWIVSPENPYFAKAIVNRVFQQLFGHGFVEPVDDLGGSNDQVLPQVLDLLAVQFQRQGYSLDFLYETLTLTRAYALGPAAEDAPNAATSERQFAAHPIRPLTADQALNSLLRAAGAEQFVTQRSSAAQRKLRNKINTAFMNEDEADSLDFTAALPQALFLMNGKLTNEVLELESNPVLQQILASHKGNAGRLEAMFLTTLSRPPTAPEQSRLLRQLKSARHGHGEAVVDLYWALLNSSEFLTNY